MKSYLSLSYLQSHGWEEYRTPEGEVYYYNTATGATQWEKPRELMSSEDIPEVHALFEYLDVNPVTERDAT